MHQENVPQNKRRNTLHMSNNEANLITRESIRTALLQLMDSVAFEKITVSELVRKAGVSRQSFYRNYKTKEDVIMEIEKKILDDFKQSLDDPIYQSNLRMWIYDFFKKVRENRNLVTVLIRAGLSNVLLSEVPFIVEEWMGNHSSSIHYYIVGSLGALRSIVEGWIQSGMKESCEEMTNICMRYDLGSLLAKKEN